MKSVHKQTDSGIHYWVSGTIGKPLIVFVHAAFADHRCFEDQLLFLSKDFRMIAIDLVGHGLSQDVTNQGTIGSSSFHIREIVYQENYKKVFLVGVSLGSLIAQDFYYENPELVDALVVIGGYDISKYDGTVSKAQSRQNFLAMLRAIISIRWFAHFNSQMVAVTLKGQKLFYEMNLLFKRKSFLCMKDFSLMMKRVTGKKVKCPLLIVCGDQDLPLVKNLSEDWHKDNENSRLAIINNAGHCANMDNLEEFNPLLCSFLKNVENENLEKKEDGDE